MVTYAALASPEPLECALGRPNLKAQSPSFQPLFHGRATHDAQDLSSLNLQL